MTLIALSLLLLAPPTPDYGFACSVENWVIDTCPKPIKISDYAPPAVSKLIMQFSEGCYKCRDRAAEDLKAMGDKAVPWLFWGLRHKRDAQIRLSCWRLLREMCTCKTCKGTGRCQEFRPGGDGWSCLGCGFGEYGHTRENDLKCKNCVPGDLDMTDLRF